MLAVAAGVGLAAALAGPASAKEPAGVVSFAPSLAPTTTTSSCAVKSFKTSGTTGVGDTGLSSVSADYQVKPCDSKQTVTVEVLVYESFDPSNVLYDDTAAPLSGKATVFGVKVGTLYKVVLTVRDATTGATVGEASASAKAPVPTGA